MKPFCWWNLSKDQEGITLTNGYDTSSPLQGFWGQLRSCWTSKSAKDAQTNQAHQHPVLSLSKMWLWQRQGEMLTVHTVAPWFLEGLEDVPEVAITTAHSRSMTQKVLYQFVKHFIAALPEGYGPVVLLLDGHRSRWSVLALQLLLPHNVFPIFPPVTPPFRHSRMMLWSTSAFTGCLSNLHDPAIAMDL